MRDWYIVLSIQIELVLPCRESFVPLLFLWTMLKCMRTKLSWHLQHMDLHRMCYIRQAKAIQLIKIDVHLMATDITMVKWE